MFADEYSHPLRKVVGGALEQCANSHNDRTDEDGLLATKGVADEDGEDSTAETSQVVRCDCDTLVSRSGVSREVRGVEFFHGVD